MIKPLASHNHDLREIKELRTYNSKSFHVPESDEVLTEFHVKPIHYVGVDRKWHDLDRIASYFGNRNGMILKEGWENLVDFGWLVWYQKRLDLIGGRGIFLPEYSKINLPLLLNTVSTFYPAAGTGSGSVDGTLGRDYGTYGRNATWSAVHDATGATEGATTGATGGNFSDTYAGTTSDRWSTIVRSFYTFDTSSIPDGDSISAATFSTYGQGLNNPFTATAHITASSPASNDNLVAADYDNVSDTSFGSIAFSSLSASAYNDFTLNASGLSNISKIGVSKFAGRSDDDVDNIAPTWSSSADSYYNNFFADETGTSKDPKLAVTHAAAAFKPRMTIV